MRTIVVPTDYSSQNAEAAQYALAMAAHHGFEQVLLYHAYQLPLTGDPMLPSVELLGLEELKAAAEKGMRAFAAGLTVPPGVQLDTLTEYNVMEEGVAEWSQAHKVALVVASLEQGSDVEEWLLGSNAVALARNIQLPVLALPPGAVFQPIKNLLLACDYEAVNEHLPAAQLLGFLQITGAQLMVLHIDAEHKSLTMEQEHQRLVLEDVLAGVEGIQYHHVRHEGFSDAVNEFAHAHQAGAVAVVPKKHGWFSGLFRKHHTRELAFHTKYPLLMMHR